jgi:hypothetical protein
VVVEGSGSCNIMAEVEGWKLRVLMCARVQSRGMASIRILSLFLDDI